MDKDYKLQETLVLTSADIYQEVYNIIDWGYDVAVSEIIDQAKKFEDEWEELSKDDSNDYIKCLEAFEERYLVSLRKRYGTHEEYQDYKKG